MSVEILSICFSTRIYIRMSLKVGPDGRMLDGLLELDAIVACIIGGLGACLGALFMASLDNGMSLKGVPDFAQNVVKGGIWVIAVGFDVLGMQRD